MIRVNNFVGRRILCVIFSFVALFVHTVNAEGVPSLLVMSVGKVADGVYTQFEEMTPFNTDVVKAKIIQGLQVFPVEMREQVENEFVAKYTRWLGNKVWDDRKLEDATELFDGHVCRWGHFKGGAKRKKEWINPTFDMLLNLYVERMKTSPYQRNWHR